MNVTRSAPVSVFVLSLKGIHRQEKIKMKQCKPTITLENSSSEAQVSVYKPTQRHQADLQRYQVL